MKKSNKAKNPDRPYIDVRRSTPQEVFNFVALQLLAQNRQAKDAVGCLTLLDRTGARCAIGWCAPLSLDDDMEGRGPGDVFSRTGLIHSWLHSEPHSVERCMLRLQTVHDLHKPSEWPRGLKRAAEVLKLDSSIVDYFETALGEIEQERQRR